MTQYRHCIQNSGYELKSHLCTLNREEDHINGCTLRSRPCPNTAGKFGLGLSALAKKLHTTHTASYYCITRPILCLLCSKEAQSNDNTYCRYRIRAHTRGDRASRLTHNATFPNQFCSYKINSLICLFSTSLLMFLSVERQ